MITLPLDQIQIAPWNYKTDDPGMQSKLEGNLKRNGQIENLIVREIEGSGGMFECVNGNHRLKAMRSLGIPSAICYNLGAVSELQAKRIALETNETKFGADNIRLAEIVSELVKEVDLESLNETLPFTDEEIQNFGTLLGFDWSQFEAPTEVSFQAGADEFTETIEVKVSRETLQAWKQLQERMTRVLGYDNPSKVFEFAVIEALAIPEASLRP